MGELGTQAEYVAWLTGHGYARATVDKRTTFFARIVGEWGSLNPPPPEKLAAWLNGYDGWTRRTYLNHLKSVLTFLAETGVIDDDPLARYRRPPTPRPRPKPLTDAEQAAILDTDDQRLRTWLLLGCLAGLRAHEIAKMHGSDIDERVIFVRGKGAQEALLPTHPILWGIAETFPRGGYWFPSPHTDRDHVHYSLISNTIRAHFRAHGITNGATHRLRATYGTNLRRAGVDMRLIQELMRHKSLVTTEHYLGVGEDELAVAVRKLAA